MGLVLPFSKKIGLSFPQFSWIILEIRGACPKSLSPTSAVQLALLSEMNASGSHALSAFPITWQVLNYSYWTFFPLRYLLCIRSCEFAEFPLEISWLAQVWYWLWSLRIFLLIARSVYLFLPKFSNFREKCFSIEKFELKVMEKLLNFVELYSDIQLFCKIASLLTYWIQI